MHSTPVRRSTPCVSNLRHVRLSPVTYGRGVLPTNGDVVITVATGNTRSCVPGVAARAARALSAALVAGGDLRYQFRTGGEHVDVHILGWIGLAAIILTLIAIDIVVTYAPRTSPP